jgi:hypothetical protein
MVNPDDARLLDACAYDLVLGDSTRSLQRALINSLANGEPPYSREEQEKNQVRINVSDLTHPRILHDGRSQYFNGIMSQARYFTANTDWGPKHSRSMNSQIVMKEANRVFKDDIGYFESQRSDIANGVLHGISPGVWENDFNPIPRPMGPEDVLIPARTLLGFSNLPFFFLRRPFTAMEFEDVTRAYKRDPGWNMEFVGRCLEWLDRQMSDLSNNNYPESMAFEKWVELRKEQGGGMFATDQVPVVDTFDVYIYKEATRTQPAGWVRRIILDSWSNPGFSFTPGGWTIQPATRRTGRKDKDGKDIDGKRLKKDFIYSSGDRIVGSTWQEIVKFQFADLSAVAPFRYHSVRSLGWLTYAQCHLKNRLYCKTMEAVFEALMQLFQVDNMDDAQTALKMELANFAVIDKTLKPIPAAERWQPDAGLIELGIGLNASLIDKNSQSWTAAPTQQNKERETNLQRMADLQQVNALVSSGLLQYYAYKRFEYMECFRRLLIPNSQDFRVRRFREACLRQGVPEKVLNSFEAWDIQSERMMGGGNQTLEMMIAQQLMEWREKYDPEAQRDILRIATGAVTKDPALAQMLVPDQPHHVTSSTDKAGTDVAKLLQNVPAEPLPGTNEIEYTTQQIKILAQRVKAGMQRGMVDPKELKGLQAIAQNIAQHIQIIAKDPEQKPVVKQLGDILGKLVNEIKAFAQRLQEAMKKQAQQNGNQGVDPKAMAKAQEIKMMGDAKRKDKAESSAQKLAQDQVKFEQGLRQDAVQHRADLAATDLEAASNIRRSMFDEPDDTE